MSIGLIGGIVLLVILTIAVFVALKKLPNYNAEKFINELGDKILEVVLETISDTDPNRFNTFDEFRDTVVKNVYDAVWEFVSYVAKEELADDQITKTVFKLIDKDRVIKFLDSLFESENINETIKDAYGSFKITQLINDDEDEKLQKEYSDQTLYVENSEEFELPPAEEKEIPPEELAKIIPPVDDEDESLDLEDDSVELIVDKKEIIQTKDKNGNPLYYEVDENGKKARVSKEYALQNM